MKRTKGCLGSIYEISYFDVPLGDDVFDAAVSVESLHHFEKTEKVRLYTMLHRALRDGSAFILTDYFALTEDEERSYREALCALKRAQGIADGELYHYDTPLTVAHECEALIEAGFATVEVVSHWGATHTIRATK